jgi:hypothetical protein
MSSGRSSGKKVYFFEVKYRMVAAGWGSEARGTTSQWGPYYECNSIRYVALFAPL